MNTYDLNGRNAVITGGGSGIGYATAERFLRSGASVEIWGRDTDKLKAAQKSLAAFGPATWRRVDVSDWDQVEAGAKGTLQQYGHIDILFNCAGLSLYVGPMLDVRVQSWRDTSAINLDSVFFCCRALAPQMIERGYGRIVNTSSMAGKEGNANQAAYSASKAAVIALTKSFAKEIATTGVLVNCICPTVFDTPVVRETLEKAPHVMKAFTAKIPMNRIGQAQEAAALVSWLASEDCSFTTGFTFDLSGGRATY